jgi:hypothetical protein
LTYVLINLRKLFSLYMSGSLFSFEHVTTFRKLSKFLIAWVLFSIIYESIKSVIFSFANPPGERVLGISFGSEELTLVVVALFVYIIAWVMDEGRVLVEESEMTI